MHGSHPTTPCKSAWPCTWNLVETNFVCPSTLPAIHDKSNDYYTACATWAQLGNTQSGSYPYEPSHIRHADTVPNILHSPVPGTTYFGGLKFGWNIGTSPRWTHCSRPGGKDVVPQEHATCSYIQDTSSTVVSLACRIDQTCYTNP